MPKTKISEFSATPANNTDIDSINISEGCAPSGINDAIRELMAQLKDFQTGAVGDSFNGPVGTSTAAAGAFTTLSASSTVTLSGGTANGVAYLNGSKVVTSGSALTFDGTNFAVGAQGEIRAYNTANTRYGRFVTTSDGTILESFNGAGEPLILSAPQSSAYIGFKVNNAEGMRLTSTGLGIGTSSPGAKLDVTNGASPASRLRVGVGGGAANTLYSTLAAGDYINFETNGSERARITSSGDFLVGTTSASVNTFLKDSANDIVLDVANSSSSNCYGLRVRYSAVAPNTVGYYFYRAQDNAATRFEVYSNGGIANYSGNNVNLSDRREKTNFAPAKSYLDVICSIPVQTFNYIDQNMEDDGGLTLGVVAQDVQAVAPELVMESNWASKDEAPKMRLSVYQTDLQYALMKALQELKAEFDAYKASHP